MFRTAFVRYGMPALLAIVLLANFGVPQLSRMLAEGRSDYVLACIG